MSIRASRVLQTLLFGVVFCCLLAGSAVPADQAGQAQDGRYAAVAGVREFSGRLIVRPVQLDVWLAAGLNGAQAWSRVGTAHRIVQDVAVDYVWQTDEYIVAVPEGATENGASAALMSTGLFQYAEPDWILYPVAAPNDPGYGNQWHHAANRMQSADGWSIHTGNPSVGVGICDTGVRTTHEDLLLNRREGYNAVDKKWESQGGAISPVHRHGTETTGCAAANGNNAKGVAGVGWNLSHRMLRVSNSSSGSASLSTLQHAARTAVEAGDKVASVSYSGCDTSSNLTTASYIKSIGGLLIWAAGNDGRNLTYGNRDNDDLIVVGATDQNDAKAYFSAYGTFVDLAAPGVSVYTTDSDSNTDYAYASGTSFATPLTAGLAALIWSYDPALSPDDVEARLKAGCNDLGSAGVDNAFGYGRINVYGSLSQGGGPSNQPPVADLAAAPLSGDAPLLVSFDASGSYDTDGTIVSYEWDFDGDGTYDLSTGTNPTAQYTYTSANDYDPKVRVTDDDDAAATDTVHITVSSPGGQPESIAFDGWESGNYSGGTGWLAAWTRSGDVSISTSSGPHSGSRHARLRRSTGYLRRAADLSGATGVHLTFWAKAYSFESSDRAYVYVSPDGSNYTQVQVFTSAQSDNTYHFYDIDLSGFAMTSNFRIVFDAAMSASSDYWYIDDIEITGVR